MSAYDPKPRGNTSVIMTPEQRKAVKRLAPYLRAWHVGIATSNVNLSGPHYGEITDRTIVRELRAIEAFCFAFDIEHDKLEKVCADELAELRRLLKRR